MIIAGNLMEGPGLGFKHVNFESFTFATKYFWVGFGPQIDEPKTGYASQINSDSKSCHGPEDGAGNQTLVGDRSDL